MAKVFIMLKDDKKNNYSRRQVPINSTAGASCEKSLMVILAIAINVYATKQ